MLNAQNTISMKQTLADRTKMHILLFLFLFALLFPPFDALLGNFGSGLVNIGLIILGSFVMLWNGSRVKFYHKKEVAIVTLILLVMIYNFLSIYLNHLIHIQQIGFRDVVEYYRPVLYAVSFCLPLILIHKIKDFDFITNVLLMLLCFMFCLSLGQFLGLAQYYGGLYTKIQNYRGTRVTIPFVSPYDYSYFLNLFLAYFIFRFLETRQIKMICVALVPAALITFTQSRGGFIGAFVLIFFIIPFLLFAKYIKQILMLKINRRFILLAFMAILMVTASGTVLYSFRDGPLSYLWAGKKIFTVTTNKVQPKSISNRADQIEYTVDQALKSPYVAFFGRGALKNEGILLESIYAYYGNRYGLIGILVLLIFPLAVGSIYSFSNSLYASNTAMWQALCAWFLLLPVIGVTNNLNEQMRLSFFYYFFIGMCVRGYYLRFSTDT